jgi:UDP-N-acetylmuramoyl-L-alanyl-D-glutamate--2,6-diaminopimelate ligase
MLLSKLLNNLSVIQVLDNSDDFEVENITIDSREVQRGSIFVAIKGFKTDGHLFIQQAISNGASAIVLEDDKNISEQLFTKNNVTKILVENSRKALAKLADTFFDSPSKKLNLTGITGTKGKTTTTYFLKNIFENANMKTGLIGTNKNMIGKKEIKTKMTTPESHIINSLLSEMVKEDCSQCVMEVSSHSLELHRVDFLDFNVGVFTNITSDHLDFHNNFKNYLAAKKIFFDQLKPEAKVIYNKDDKNHSVLLENCTAEKISYGLHSNADIKIENVNFSLEGTEFQIKYLENTYHLNTKLIGEFNAYNATAAFAASVFSGVSITQAIEGIKSTPQVPGRFEVISKGNKKVIVDYSHTADSLKQALHAIKYIVKDEHPVYTIFGCGGDRDKTKRPVMGSIAEQLSNYVYVTSDNPRTEDPYAILSDIEKGLQKDNHKIIENREEAIKRAIENSEDDAVILIAGKGHETYQEINGTRNYFSDKEVAEKYL